MSLRFFVAAGVLFLCRAHRRIGHQRDLDPDLQGDLQLEHRGHVLQFQDPASYLQANPEVEKERAPNDAVKYGLLGAGVLLLVVFSYCCLNTNLLSDLLSSESDHDSEEESAAKGAGAGHQHDEAAEKSPDSSPDSKMEAGQAAPSSSNAAEMVGLAATGLDVLEAVASDDYDGLGLDAVGNVMVGLGRWTKKAKEAATAAMAKEEREIEAPPARSGEGKEEEWTDGVPEAEKRVFPRPNFLRYKWVLRTCFEHDWKFVCPRLLRELKFSEAEIEEAEQCLRTKYMWVLPLYRKLSSEETSDGGSSPDHISQFGVSKRSLMRILGPEGINILDKTKLTQAKANELYKQSNVVPQEVSSFKVRCDSMLCRFQFAELLVRLAITKWPEKSKVDALEALFEELAILCQKYSGDMRELINSGSSDEVQSVYEAIEPQTWAVFVQMASVHENQHGEKFMTLQDWRNLLNRMNVFVLYPAVKRKYGAYTYRMGLEPQADEQYNKTWQLMSFLEFQRALGAVMFLSEMRPKEECKPEIMATLLQNIASQNLSQIAIAKRESRGSLVKRR